MIYVDKLGSMHLRRRWEKLPACRMISDVSTGELKAFAIQIGLKPQWLRLPRRDSKMIPYFMIVESVRSRAIAIGAKELSPTHFKKKIESIREMESIRKRQNRIALSEN